jgi:Putative MetA-pathway of phenol degradation
MQPKPSHISGITFVAIVVGAGPAMANTAIETETAQIGAKGDFAISNSVQLEKTTDGYAVGTLTQFEYGITDRSEILIEPFFQEWDLPDAGSHSHGFGDLELTPSFEFLLENGAVPAMLVAFKLKVPTGSAPDFSTGKLDYYPYLILGQHVGGWTFNANAGVDFVTKAPDSDEPGHKQFIWDLEAERTFATKFTFFGEGFTDESGVAAVSTALQYQIGEHVNVFVAAAYDAEGTYIVRPGINIPFEQGAHPTAHAAMASR